MDEPYRCKDSKRKNLQISQISQFPNVSLPSRASVPFGQRAELVASLPISFVISLVFRCFLAIEPLP